MIRDMRYHFYETKGGNDIYFYSVKEHIEFAFYNKKTGTLYINSTFKDKFKQAKTEIKKLYHPCVISHYFNLGDLCDF